MDVVNIQGYCYIWDQTIAKHGSSDIASCLYSYIKDNIKKTSIEETTMFCDNCTGQNKNRMINQLLSLATIKIENLKNTQLIFLVNGHTQNCNDSINASIEKVKKGIHLHHPGQWDTVVQMACKNQPYEVNKQIQRKNF